MLGYLIGGSSFGFLSFQAYRKRQEKKKIDSINQQIYDHILSPHEWTEGEDVYILQSQLQSKQLKINNNPEITPQQKFLDQARSIFFNNFISLRINQWIMMTQFYKNNINNEYVLTKNEKSNIIDKSQVIDTNSISLISKIYQQLKINYERRNEEKQQQQLKKSLIQSNLCKKNGIISSTNKPSSGVNSSDERYTQQNMNLKLQVDRNIISNTSQGYYIPINQFEKNFNESIINKKSIIYQEYKGTQPQNALKEFIIQCKKHLSFKSAMIIHYYYGKGDPTSYVLAVEQNIHDSQGAFNCNHGIEGANIAVLKKTDAFKFEYDFKSHKNQQQFENLEFNKWIEFQNNQKVLKSVLEQEIESKMHISGIRQMKYIEVFSLDENENLINYSVQVPFGQNESTYDLRSKSQTSEVNYHKSFRQFDICKENE